MCDVCDVPVCGPDRIREILSLRDPLWVVSFFMQLLSRTCQMSHVVLLSLSCMMQIRDLDRYQTVLVRMAYVKDTLPIDQRTTNTHNPNRCHTGTIRALK